jgi:hypothetical protein
MKLYDALSIAFQMEMSLEINLPLQGFVQQDAPATIINTGDSYEEQSDRMIVPIQLIREIRRSPDAADRDWRDCCLIHFRYVQVRKRFFSCSLPRLVENFLQEYGGAQQTPELIGALFFWIYNETSHDLFLIPELVGTDLWTKRIFLNFKKVACGETLLNSKIENFELAVGGDRGFFVRSWLAPLVAALISVVLPIVCRLHEETQIQGR